MIFYHSFSVVFKRTVFWSSTCLTKRVDITARQFYTSKLYLVSNVRVGAGIPLNQPRNSIPKICIRFPVDTQIALLSRHTYSEDELLDDTESSIDTYEGMETTSQLGNVSTIKEILLIAERSKTVDPKFLSIVLSALHQTLRQIFRRDNEQLLDSLRKIKASPSYAKWCHILDTQHKEFPVNILASVLLSLSFIISPDDPLAVKYVCICKEQLPHFNLKALSQFSSAMKAFGENYSKLVSPVISLICPLIGDCEGEEDIRHMANCFLKGMIYTSPDCMHQFAKKVEECILCSQISDYKTALKSLVVFSKHNLDSNFTELQQLLISTVIQFVPEMNISELTVFYRCVKNSNCNSDYIVPVIEAQVVKLLDQVENVRDKCLLLSNVSFISTRLKHKLFISDWIRQHPEVMDDKNISNVVLVLLTLLRTFPARNEDILTHSFKRCASEELSLKETRQIIKEYMNFRRIVSSSVGSGDTLPEFTDLCLKNSMSSVKCHDIAFSSAFLIANLNANVPEEVLDRVDNILPQLNPSTLRILSLALSFGFQRHTLLPPNLRRKVRDLNLNVVANCRKLLVSSRNLSEYSVTLVSLSQAELCAAFEDRSKQDIIGQEFFHGYSEFLRVNKFTPTDIVRMCKLLIHNRVYLPHVLDKMAHFIIEHSWAQSSRLVANVLRSCYSHNYCPPTPEFLVKCEEVISSKLDILDCHDFLNSVISLGYFGALSHRLIHQVFSEAFLEKLENDIFLYNRPNTGALRLKFVTVNKVACLDYPEENVPWFHEHFLQIATAIGLKRMTVFEKEVYDVLCEVLNGADYIQHNLYSPYYYKINFECLLDSSSSPVKYADHDASMKFDSLPHGIRRVAVIILNDKSYCANVQRLRGPEALKQRHLEILGYKVVQIPHFEWNSLQLSSTEKKQDYLYNKIFQ